MSEKVVSLLVKWGHSIESAEAMTGKNLETATKCYPDAKPAFIAQVVATI